MNESPRPRQPGETSCGSSLGEDFRFFLKYLSINCSSSRSPSCSSSLSQPYGPQAVRLFQPALIIGPSCRTPHHLTSLQAGHFSVPSFDRSRLGVSSCRMIYLYLIIHLRVARCPGNGLLCLQPSSPSSLERALLRTIFQLPVASNDPRGPDHRTIICRTSSLLRPQAREPATAHSLAALFSLWLEGAVLQGSIRPILGSESAYDCSRPVRRDTGLSGLHSARMSCPGARSQARPGAQSRADGAGGARWQA